jgi:mRNA-degrading endonuclease RelE of RelBE toxin-antitoxin system
MYKLKIHRPAKQFFKKIRERQLANLFKEKISTLQADPYATGDKKGGDLPGVYTVRMNYQKTEYRIAYYIEENDEEPAVIIIMAGTREQFYQELKRYINRK